MSEPYTSPPGSHRHQCGGCGCVWEHADDVPNGRGHHNCPRCGVVSVWRYRGDEPPTTLEGKESNP